MKKCWENKKENINGQYTITIGIILNDDADELPLGPLINSKKKKVIYC